MGRLTKDCLVKDLTQRKTVVVGSLSDIKHDLNIDATNAALDDLKARFNAKFSNLNTITTEQPETIYEMRARQNELVYNMNKLATN